MYGLWTDRIGLPEKKQLTVQFKNKVIFYKQISSTTSSKKETSA